MSVILIAVTVITVCTFHRMYPVILVEDPRLWLAHGRPQESWEGRSSIPLLPPPFPFPSFLVFSFPLFSSRPCLPPPAAKEPVKSSWGSGGALEA